MTFFMLCCPSCIRPCSAENTFPNRFINSPSSCCCEVWGLFPSGQRYPPGSSNPGLVNLLPHICTCSITEQKLVPGFFGHIKQGEASRRLLCFKDCAHVVGQDEVLVPSLLVYHLLQHPLQHLVESVDEATCLSILNRHPDLLNLQQPTEINY